MLILFETMGALAILCAYLPWWLVLALVAAGLAWAFVAGAAKASGN